MLKEKYNEVMTKFDFDKFKIFISTYDCYTLLDSSLPMILKQLDINAYRIFDIGNIKNYKEILDEKIFCILNFISPDDFEYAFKNYFKGDPLFLKNNLAKLFNSLPFNKFLLIINYIEKMDTIDEDLLLKLYSNNKDLIVESLISDSCNKNMKDKERNSLIKLLVMLIDEICVYENKLWKDIRIHGYGCHSSVLGIGDKVIKFGIREKYEIPNNKYLVKPLIRYNFNELNKNCNLVVEVIEILNCKVKISIYERVEINDYLHSIGQVYTDISVENFGVFLKDNKVYWDKPLGDHNGIIGECNEELKAGDYAIADSDYLYRLDDPDIKYFFEYEMFMREVGNLKVRGR